MTTEAPPKFYFNDIIFNSEYYQDEDTTGFSQDQADLRYLKKNITDTATALETFSGGIKLNSIEPINDTDTLNINTVSDTAINIVNIGNTATNNQTLNLNSKTINIGDTTVPSAVNIISPSTFTGTATFNGLINATRLNTSTAGTAVFTANVVCPKFNAGGGGGIVLDFCDVQTTAVANICNNPIRTGAINICNALTTGVGQNINIGSNVITSGTQTINLGGSQTISGGGSQTINVNKPLTIGYTVNPTSLNQIGGVQAIAGSIITMASATPTTLVSFTTLPLGVYMIFYAIDQTTSFLTLSITLERHAITNTTNSFTSIESNISERRTVAETATTAGGSAFNIDYTINNSGIIVVSPTNENIFVVAQFDHTNTGTGNLFSRCDARVVRIG
jgi:hypothetical protein